jgi:hypothetical protein
MYVPSEARIQEKNTLDAQDCYLKGVPDSIADTGVEARVKE